MPIKKGLLLVCGKTGRVVGLNRQSHWAKWLFPIIGLASLIWYLVRVIPKPSRANYPCQRVAMPVAIWCLSYFLSLFGAVSAYRQARKLIRQNRYVVAAICLVVAATCAAVVMRQNEMAVLASESTGTFVPVDGPDQPIGVARGLYPGRVAWSYDTNACNWDGVSSYWWSSTWNNQTKITKLMNNVICSVAGQSSVSNAWDVLFRNKNGGPSYVKGEKIAIKINENNGGGASHPTQIDASPQSVYALLDGLVNQFGASQTDITICDPAKEAQCSAVSNYCRAAFPGVNFDMNLGGFTASAFTYSTSGPTENSLSTTLVNAKYLITMALLKRHAAPSPNWPSWGSYTDDGNSPVSMIFKSSWGLIGNNRASEHPLLRAWENPIANYDVLVDIYGSKHINGKTVVNIVDGLYSAFLWNSGPTNWVMAPFNNHWPSSFFASQDPVALESVGLDFFWADMGLTANADRHLREAALANNPPSGTVYKPDGVRLQSLGVHEHWNNSTNKQFSRNLGTGLGIELVTIAPGVPSVSIAGFASGAVFSQGTNLPIQSVVINNTNPISQVAFYQGTTLLGTATGGSTGITWSNEPTGNFTLTAVATDSLGLSVTSNPVTISVVLPVPSVSITNPANGSLITPGTNLPIQAAVLNDTNTVNQIVFFQGTTPLGTSTSSPFGVTWSSVPAGNYVLTAIATDSLGLSITSSPVNITVSAPPTAVTWDANTSTAGAQDGGGTWNLTSPNWWNGTTDVTWNNTVAPIMTTFGTANAPAGTVTLGAAITVSNLTFNAAASGDYTIAGGYTLTIANTPVVSVAANCSPTISASVAGSGFSKTGAGTLILGGANTMSGTLAISGGTLALSGNNSGSTAAVTVTSGAALRLANAGGLTGALALNSGSTLQLRADANTTFAPASVALDNASDVNNFDVGPAGSVAGKTLTLSGALAYANSSDQTINVTGSGGYALGLGAISMTATSHNPYRMMNVNVAPGLGVVIASFKSGNYGNYFNATGGGNVTVTGNLANTSNGSVDLFVNGGTTATLQGQSVKSGAGDAYRYHVPNGTLVVDNNGALINDTTGAGLNSSQFILGAATNLYSGISGVSPPASVLVSANNSYNCAVYLGDASYPNGGLTLAANVTNYVSDGDVGFVNSGTMTIGGQNTSGINTYANPIILGWTANKGKGVTLAAATGGEVDFTGGILQNGTDTTAGVKVGDATHGGIVKFTSANTYGGGTTIANGTLLVNNFTGSGTGSGAVAVNSGGKLGGTGIISGAVTVNSGGTLSAGTAAIGTLTINNSLTLAGNILVKINKSQSPSNDLVTVSGALNNSGAGVLTLTNLGPACAAGDSFKVFSKALANGGALTLNPATPGYGLRWVNNLAVNGTLNVVGVATTSVSLAPNFNISNLTLSWQPDHTGWRLQAQTNLSGFGLGTNWADVCGSTGTNQCIMQFNPTNGAVFYRLVYP
jgi:autotransporter-associated beta strand protein